MGSQTQLAYSSFGRTRETNRVLRVYGSSNSLAKRRMKPNVAEARHFAVYDYSKITDRIHSFEHTAIQHVCELNGVSRSGECDDFAFFYVKRQFISFAPLYQFIQIRLMRTQSCNSCIKFQVVGVEKEFYNIQRQTNFVDKPDETERTQMTALRYT
jgi:hypothetical protein